MTRAPSPLWRSLVASLAASLLLGAPLARAASISEFPVPTGNAMPFSIVAGPDGALWFTEFGGNRIGRISPAGAATDFAVPTPASQPFSIAVGADGRLWFTEVNGNKIGQVTTSGAITEVATPSGGNPGGIAAGPDGALWFTEISGNKIGRITTTGAITEFAVPTAASAPHRIAAGVDGALWFTEVGAGKIGRITTAGAITEFPLPNSAAKPFDITSGPDGALWFTEFDGNKIGRLSTAGVMTEFAVPTAGSEPALIGVGPDGALWFSETGAGKLGRVSSLGAITEFAIPTGGSEPQGVAAGPDGALWFVEEAANKVGRLLPDPGASFIFAAVLPSSRSITLGAPVTAFATLINSDSKTALGCGIVPITSVPARFTFQTTNPVNNAVTGSPNAPVDIPAGQAQTFVVALSANAPFAPTDVAIGFACTNESAASSISGVNTLLLSGSSTPVPDIVALAATSSNDGIIDVSNVTAMNAFAVATVNVGAGGTVVVTADTGGISLPVAVSLCQTNPTTGKCLAAAASSVTTTINSNATPTFAVFVTQTATVPFAPATNRIFVRFRDGSGVVRGSTSVAVRTE